MIGSGQVYIVRVKQTWLSTPITLALGKWRQEEQLKVIIYFIVSLRFPWATQQKLKNGGNKLLHGYSREIQEGISP